MMWLFSPNVFPSLYPCFPIYHISSAHTYALFLSLSLISTSVLSFPCQAQLYKEREEGRERRGFHGEI